MTILRALFPRKPFATAKRVRNDWNEIRNARRLYGRAT